MLELLPRRRGMPKPNAPPAYRGAAPYSARSDIDIAEVAPARHIPEANLNCSEIGARHVPIRPETWTERRSWPTNGGYKQENKQEKKNKPMLVISAFTAAVLLIGSASAVITLLLAFAVPGARDTEQR
jgi:hypothetical protein